MSAGAGKDFLLKISVGGVYTLVGGLRSSSLNASAEAIDITSLDSDQYKELLDGAGIRAIALKGSGILKSSAPISTIRSSFINQTLTNWQLIEVNGIWQAAFKVISFEVAGDYKGAQTYSLSLESSGAFSFT